MSIVRFKSFDGSISNVFNCRFSGTRYVQRVNLVCEWTGLKPEQGRSLTLISHMQIFHTGLLFLAAVDLEETLTIQMQTIHTVWRLLST